LFISGKILVAGGENNSGYLNFAEVYDPVTNSYTNLTMNFPRGEHTATLLNNSTVLITGGRTSAGALATAEIYNPQSNSFARVGDMNTSHVFHQAVLLRNGTVLLIGNAKAEIYDPLTFAFRLTGPSIAAGTGFNEGSSATTLENGMIFVSGGNAYDYGLPTLAAEAWNPLQPFPTRVISSHVTNGGSGVPGVLMTGLPGFPLTDQAGYYEGVVMTPWTGTVMSIKAGYAFDPASIPYTNVTTDLSGQDYTTTGITFTISGNAGVGGATLSYNDGGTKSVVADGGGAYTLTVSYNWSGTVTPTKTNYTFSPVSRAYANVQANATDQNYTATVGSYTLTITKAGTGTGTVTSNPAGINCGTTCLAAFTRGTQVTLTATGDVGLAFTAWTGDFPPGQGSTNPLTITMDANKTITANFTAAGSMVQIDTSWILGCVKSLTTLNTTLAASGGLPPYSWSIASGTLPAGITLNSSTGRLTGTPSVSGMFPFTVRVTDSASQSDTQDLTLPVAKVLLWYSGPGNGYDSANAVATDTLGNVYVTGAAGGDYRTNKFNSAGALQWGTSFKVPPQIPGRKSVDGVSS
jgi:hypothetical protein